MAGKLNQAELLKIFPVVHAPVVAHGRSRHRTRKTMSAHGRSRHHRDPLAPLAKKDPFKHKAEARRQG